MRGDFSRLTWDRRKHYSAVLMQQGRLQMDADWNEQIDIIMHRLETEVADYVGPSGVPARAPDGFRIQVSPDGGSVVAGPGRMYVEGRLIENEAAAPAPLADLLAELSGKAGRRFVAYLDTWPRLVSFAEDPGLREVALGGPDTAARRQTAWRVRLAAADDKATPASIPLSWQPARLPIGTGLLNARVGGDLPSLENQLYRVEVYSSAGQEVTFTWSRDNGSVGARVTDVQAATRTLSVEGGGRDADTAVAERQWVELLTEAQDQAGERGVVVQIDRADTGRLVVGEASWPWTGDQVPEIRVLRRWDDPAGLVTAPLATGGDDTGWVPLESGVEVRFETAPDGADQYVPGDYWLIASRHDTASIEWPLDTAGPTAQPAHGVRHTYAALALLDRDAKGNWTVVDGGDLRPLVSPLDDGFVSKGTAGDLMRGPLSVQPLLRATAAGEELVAVRLAPAFDDAGQAYVQHTALKVTGGDVVLGAPDQPVATTATGSLTVSGALRTTTAHVDEALTVMGTVDITGLVGESGTLAQTALRIGTDPGSLELASGGTPNAGFLRFGDLTGWKFHIGRGRDGASAPPNLGTAGALLTVVDNGRVGIGTTAPTALLHVASSGSGATLAVSGLLAMSSMQNYLASASTPNGTAVVGCSGGGANLAAEGVYFFWKNVSGDRFGAYLTPDPELTRIVRQSGST